MNNYSRRKRAIIKFLKTYMLLGLCGVIDTTTPELYNKFVAYKYVYNNLLDDAERDVIEYLYVKKTGNIKDLATILNVSIPTAYRRANACLVKFFNVEV